MSKNPVTWPHNGTQSDNGDCNKKAKLGSREDPAEGEYFSWQIVGCVSASDQQNSSESSPAR